MAINKQTLVTRAWTALIFVLVMFAGLLWNRYSFLVLCCVIMIGCLFEFIQIMRKIPGSQPILYYTLSLIYIVLPLWLLYWLGINGNAYLQRSGSTGYTPFLPLTIIFSLWINDTMAYLVGSWIGKTPFSRISPKKTWEGTLGGVVLCVVSMGLLGPALSGEPALTAFDWVCIALICSVFGTAGDLLESKLKRLADVKDSGTFMPGHGGFLDRFDSMLIATPFVWLYVRFLL